MRAAAHLVGLDIRSSPAEDFPYPVLRCLGSRSTPHGLMPHDLYGQAPRLVAANPDPYPLPEPQAFGAIAHLYHEWSLAVGPLPAYSSSRRAIPACGQLLSQSVR